MFAAIALALLATQAAPVETLFQGSKLTCKDWAVVANYYIDLGEDKACSDLLYHASAGKTRANTRVCLICRILFEGKGKSGLRPPKLGDLSLPSLPQSSWPEYPLLQQDGVWMCLDENYRPGGFAEPASNYIDYCRKNGRFRGEKLAVPTRQEAEGALSALQGTKRWRDIRWSDSDLHSSYTYDRSWTIDFLRSQTRFEDGLADF